ncbi:MAG: hypothetical protein RJA99_846 [Pseudomonadota bacterium]
MATRGSPACCWSTVRWARARPAKATGSPRSAIGCARTARLRSPTSRMRSSDGRSPPSGSRRSPRRWPGCRSRAACRCSTGASTEPGCATRPAGCAGRCGSRSRRNTALRPRPISRRVRPAASSSVRGCRPRAVRRPARALRRTARRALRRGRRRAALNRAPLRRRRAVLAETPPQACSPRTRQACRVPLRRRRAVLAETPPQAPYCPTIVTDETFWLGNPPRLCVIPQTGADRCRSPARPLSCRYIS